MANIFNFNSTNHADGNEDDDDSWSFGSISGRGCSVLVCSNNNNKLPVTWTLPMAAIRSMVPCAGRTTSWQVFVLFRFLMN